MGQVSKLIRAGYLYKKLVFPFTFFSSQNESCLKFKEHVAEILLAANIA